MSETERAAKRNLTVSLRLSTIKKAKVLAARRSTSISGLLAEQIEKLVSDAEEYERCKREALGHLEAGFHLGGVRRATRDELHER